MRITMTEIEAGAGYNDGPELRLVVQSSTVTDLPSALRVLSPSQAETFTRYQRQPSHYRPLLGEVDGYRFNDEWTFAIKDGVA